MWPPILGQQGVQWHTVFKLIKQPGELWDTWKPAKSLDQYGSVETLWSIFEEGKVVYTESGIKTGVKPPFSLVEKFFGSSW